MPPLLPVSAIEDLRRPAAAVRWRAWWRGRSSFEQDVVIAVAACAFGEAMLVLEPEDTLRGVMRPVDATAVALVAGMSLPLAWRRRAPLLALLVPALCTIAGVERGSAVFLASIFVLFGVASAARYTDRRTAVLLGCASAVLTASLASSEITGGASVTTVVGGIMIGGGPAVIGDAFRMQAQLTATVRDHAFRLDQLRDAEVRGAMASERIEIARDIHDIVGHHLSAISLQAAAGRRIAGRPDADVGPIFAQIGALTSEALDETRRVLGVLRHDGAEYAPSPRLGDVEQLLDGVRAAGVPVELAMAGTVREVPSGIETCAYRIVQEALTNVAKHARPARATVTIEYLDDALRVAVRDDGRAVARHADPQPGHGIVGMRERVGLAGGELRAGPGAGGGWCVEAVLPTAAV